MTTNIGRLKELVNYFVDYTPNRHFGNLNALNTIANDLESWFQSFGLQVSRQSWDVGSKTYYNIIGKYNPKASKRLVVGAHYDVYADNPGADDNASGMAGLIEAARLIAAANPKLDYGIDFVAYCLEEPPFFGTNEMGSYIHAHSLNKDKVDVLGMICYDMIGYFSDEPNSQIFPTEELAKIYPNQGNFILVVGRNDHQSFAEKFHSKMASVNELDVQLIIFSGENSLAELSDHKNYWHYEYDALMINNSAFLRNENYHEKTDTADTLDYEKMKLVIDASIQAICAL